MKKVLVCGATGFIGRNMAEALAENGEFEVHGTFFRSSPPVHPIIKMIKADLTDKNDVERAVKGMDIVIQAAASTAGAKVTVSSPHFHLADNTVMNALLLRAAFEHKVSHFVFFSCTVMYHSSDVPLKETDFDAGREIYPAYFGGAWLKVYFEKMCELYSRLGDTKFTVIRHSNIYGPYDKFDLEKSHVFGATLTKIMNAGDGGRITVWGDGTEERDLLYVSDLVEFVKLAVAKQKEKFQLFNAGFGLFTTVTGLVQKIILHSGKTISMEYDASKPTLKTKVCLDTEKARQLLGWQPKVSLDEGIEKTMTWYRKHPGA